MRSSWNRRRRAFADRDRPAWRSANKSSFGRNRSGAATFATQETVDQRTNDQDASQAAVEDAKARVRDAEARSRILPRAARALHRPHRRTPGFDRKPGGRQPRRHQPDHAAGNRWSRSIRSILDFDMSESDFLTFFARARPPRGPDRQQGRNRAQRRERFRPAKARSTSSTTRASIAPAAPFMHAPRCEMRDLFLAPGQFARLARPIALPTPVLSAAGRRRRGSTSRSALVIDRRQ